MIHQDESSLLLPKVERAGYLSEKTCSNPILKLNEILPACRRYPKLIPAANANLP